MTLGKFVHWLGILVILAVCFADPLQGKEQNVLSHRSYVGILFGLALTLLGIEVRRGDKRVSLLELAADWLFEEEPIEPPAPEAADAETPPAPPPPAAEAPPQPPAGESSPSP
jgi:hypothetical protein